MLVFIALLIVSVLIHLLSITAVARSSGVALRIFSLGFGPTLFKTGKFRLGAIPTGGYVQFRDTREEYVPKEALHTALDTRPAIQQCSIMLAGCTTHALLAFALLGPDAFHAMLIAPWQLLLGALSPLDEAHLLIENIRATVKDSSWITIFGLIMAKHAALNLLPLPALNGGLALAVVARRLGIDRWWPEVVSRWLFFALIGIFVSWCFTVITYLVQS